MSVRTDTDPLAILDVDAKTIAGKYVLKEDPRKKWNHLHPRERKALVNDQKFSLKVYGDIRLDSQNKAIQHGQFDSANTRLKYDARKIEQEVAEKLTSADCELDELEKDEPEVNYPKNPEKIQAEAAPCYEERFPLKKPIPGQPAKIGEFEFNMSGFWNHILSTTEKFVPAVTIDYLALRQKILKSKQQSTSTDLPDGTSLVEAAKLGKEEPIKTLEPVLEELDEEEVEDALKQSVPPQVTASEEVEKEKDEFDGVVTAYDFVNKFKEGKIKPTCNHGQKVLELTKPQTALDSQGFNSFIGYAPDLSKFHREQLITLLIESVLFSDNGILIINKPYGLISQGKIEKEGINDFEYNLPDVLPAFAQELVKRGIVNEQQPELRICHRLDKDTTGTLVLATNSSKAAEIHELFAENRVTKEYLTITRGIPDPEKGIIDIPVEVGSVSGRERMVLRPVLREDLRRIASPSKMAKRAVTSYKVIDSHGSAALVQVEPQTGVKHQIRVHLGFALRCPILGDHKYSFLKQLAPQKLPADMLMSLNVRPPKVRNIPIHLHAQTIFLPGVGKDRSTVVARATLPEFFRKTMKMLKLVKK